MERPKIAQDLKNSHQSNAEIERVKEEEEKLKCGNDKIFPPEYLNEEQAELFKIIVSELEPADILANLDVYTLANAAVSINRIQIIDQSINKNKSLLLNKTVMSARKDAETAFFRYCNELCLSPQSRAKLAGLNATKQNINEDELINVLLGD